MGKKTKIGSQRKDKFYHLAKETGYRSRAAFKLIQLNRKYEFLQKARVLIDLCAAPGGWLQVASQQMPVSSLIIGVDLVPIKPIHNVITLQEDITTSKCRQALKKQLQTWKADIVLNDGAPNVGKNWLHDAFQQVQLTLQALKLATEFLVKGGSFITKVFRSKDYHSLLWVFKQFFKKVYATKPQASRTESAEIFVFCQYYIAPDKIDPKLLDPKYVFEEVDPEPKIKLNLMHPEKQRKRAEGYPDGDLSLYKKVGVSEFLKNKNHIEILNNCNELIFDDDRISNHSLTTDEIKECCKDIKVLGRKELRSLLNWRKQLRDKIIPESKTEQVHEVKNVEVENEDEQIEKKVKELELEEALELKRKKKKISREKKKLRDKMNLKMVIPNDEPIIQENLALFQLSAIKTKKQLSEVDKVNIDSLNKDLEMIENLEVSEETARLPKYLHYNKDEKNFDGLYSDSGSEEEISDEESLKSEEEESLKGDQEETDSSENAADNNPLVVDLEENNAEMKNKRKVDLWFGKDIFADIELDADEDYEIDCISEHYNRKSIPKREEILGKSLKNQKKETNEEAKGDSGESEDYDVNNLIEDSYQKKTQSKKDGFETVPQQTIKKKTKRYLDPEGLAIGTLMIQSKKAKRDLINHAWNRYSFNDDNLPDWFVVDEQKHNRKQVPVTKEMVAEYKEKLKEINDRPIKKVVEAKARKKRKMLKKLEKARKRAEAITESLDMSEKEKMHQIKAIYKKTEAGLKKNKEVTYVVAKKGTAGKRFRRPAGVKGRFKVVDPRMKKDSIKQKFKKGDKIKKK